MSQDLEPQILARDKGEAIWFLGTLVHIKGTCDTTRGAFGLIEQVFTERFESPYHLHHNEDEAFYVLEGEVTFVCDGRAITAGTGAYVFGPRGIPHGFRVEGTVRTRLLILATPAGFEEFVREVGEPATDPATPPTAPPDIEKLGRIAAKYRIDILGPLPL